MSDNSRIEWTDATWNPITGCTKISPGCDHCYAERVTERFHGPGSFEKVVLHPDRLDQPLRWKKPRLVFVNSMSDLYHDDDLALMDFTTPLTWPLPNVWLGVSVEDQKRAGLRIPALIDTPAAVRWLSCEPLLGPIDLDRTDKDALVDGGIDWVVVGGESGPGARPMHPEWARQLRDRCTASSVPFFFKQWGEWAPRCTLALCGHPCSCDGINASHPTELKRVGKKAAGRRLDGRTWDEYAAGAR